MVARMSCCRTFPTAMTSSRLQTSWWTAPCRGTAALLPRRSLTCRINWHSPVSRMRTWSYLHCVEVGHTEIEYWFVWQTENRQYDINKKTSRHNSYIKTIISICSTVWHLSGWMRTVTWWERRWLPSTAVGLTWELSRADITTAVNTRTPASTWTTPPCHHLHLPLSSPTLKSVSARRIGERTRSWKYFMLILKDVTRRSRYFLNQHQGGPRQHWPLLSSSASELSSI